jgi:hypothetical protein
MARAKPTHAAITFYVTPMHGRAGHPFPIDMLRRDCCVPRSEDDAHKIERSIAYAQYDPPLIIGIVRFYMVGGMTDPTVKRWESFGWRFLQPGEVEKHTGTPVYDLTGYMEITRTGTLR